MSLNEIRLFPKGQDLMILGLDWNDQPVLKARLPLSPSHPRAVITLLEGLALWSGRRLPAAFAVAGLSASSIADLLPQGPAWCSPLVEIHVVERRRRRVLRGVGDFRGAFRMRVLP